MAPPKTPRNVFFPWQCIHLHRSGSFLESRRVAFRVPLNFTKFEIREYLEKLYSAKVLKVNTLIRQPERRRSRHGPTSGQYYRAGPIYKKAIVTLEDQVPDAVKMISSSSNLGKNPAILKKNVSYGDKKAMYDDKRRERRFWMGVDPNAWRHPLPSLLAGDFYSLNPTSNIPEDEVQLPPDPTKPFLWAGIRRRPNANVPDLPTQDRRTIDLQPWRRAMQRMKESDTFAQPGSNPTSADFQSHATPLLTQTSFEDAQREFNKPKWQQETINGDMTSVPVKSNKGKKGPPTTGPFKAP